MPRGSAAKNLSSGALADWPSLNRRNRVAAPKRDPETQRAVEGAVNRNDFLEREAAEQSRAANPSEGATRRILRRMSDEESAFAIVDEAYLQGKIMENRNLRVRAESMMNAAQQEMKELREQTEKMTVEYNEAIRSKRKAVDDGNSLREHFYEDCRVTRYTLLKQMKVDCDTMKARCLLFERDVDFLQAESEFLHSRKAVIFDQ